MLSLVWLRAQHANVLEPLREQHPEAVVAGGKGWKCLKTPVEKQSYCLTALFILVLSKTCLKALLLVASLFSLEYESISMCL